MPSAPARWSRIPVPTTVPSLREIAGAAAAFLAVVAIVMGPVIWPSPNKVVYGRAGDPASGVWMLNQYRTGELLPLVDPYSEAVNAPEGARILRPIDITTALHDIIAALLAKALPPILAYNMLVASAIWASGFVLYLFLRYLGIRRSWSFVCGTLYTLAPSHLLEAQLHEVIAQIWVFPALVWACLALLRSRSTSAAWAVILTVAVTAFINPYLLVADLLIFSIFALAGILRALRDHDRAFLRVVSTAVVGVTACLIPLLLSWVTSRSSIESAARRGPSEIRTYSLALQEYVSPDSLNRVGVVSILAVVIAVTLTRVSRELRFSLAAVSLLGLSLSVRPESLPTTALSFAKGIYLLLPYLRVFSRYAVLISLCGAISLAILLEMMVMDGRRALRGLSVILVIAAFLEIRPSYPPAAATAGPDPVADWLAASTGNVAEYPLLGLADDRVGEYLLRQLAHGKALFNGKSPGSDNVLLAVEAADLGADQAWEVLSYAEVDRLVVHGDQPSALDDGIELVARIDHDTSGYQVRQRLDPTVVVFSKPPERRVEIDGREARLLPAGTRGIALGPKNRSILVSFSWLSLVDVAAPSRPAWQSSTNCVRLDPSGRGVFKLLPDRHASKMKGGILIASVVTGQGCG